MKKMTYIWGILLIILIGVLVVYILNNNKGDQSNTLSKEDFWNGKSMVEWGCINQPMGPAGTMGSTVRGNLSEDECYAQIVHDSNYLAYLACYKISETNLKRQCIQNSWQGLDNPTICDSLNFKLDIAPAADLDIDIRDLCYSDMAKTFRDSSYCEKSSNSGAKDACYSGLALYLKDKTLCEHISNLNEGYSIQRCKDVITSFS